MAALNETGPVFPLHSELARRMNALDWDNTKLGPLQTWPQSLKTALNIMLTSRYAMWMAWGEDLTFFYNDAYSPTLGVKNQWALGRPASEVWAEIWPAIGPLVKEVMDTGIASWNEGLLLFLERSGVPEETYHTFSYSPLSDDEGRCAGMFCVVMEETERVIGQRRMDTLRELAAALNAVNGEQELLHAVEGQLGKNLHDLPFTLTYLFDQEGQARLACATGIDRDHPLAAPVITHTSTQPWALDQIVGHAGGCFAVKLDGVAHAIPGGAWDKPPQQAVVVPIKGQGQEGPAGFFVGARNPYRPLDKDYDGFIELVAGHIGAAVANVRSFEEARKRAEALAEIDRAKTSFFSNVSHEFRTPLTLMLGPLEEALGDPTLPPLHGARLQLVHRNGVRLLKLVNSLLDFSRIEAGRMRACFRRVDLSEVTRELASNFRSATEKAGLQLSVECERLAQPVYVDPDMWEKVVLNLVSNAFKFTLDGEIRVSLRSEGGWAHLEVADTGVGIPEHELPRMFERFHRVEGSRGRSFEGTGIGLALVQELVRLHGGTISVASEQGRGSTFTVRLPLGKGHLPQDQVLEDGPDALPLGRAASYVEEALSWLGHDGADPALSDAVSTVDQGQPLKDGAVILIADDNADMRGYVQRLLGRRHECIAVEDGQAALESIRRRRPDLVLTDIMMPRLDGFGLIKAIRQDASLRDLPVIALSARAGEEARIEGLERGADDYLVKPFSSRELLARVDAALAIAHIRAEVSESLRQSEARFRNMADHAPVMIWTTDETGYCTYLSRSWFEFTGQTAEEALGYGWLEATHPDDKARAQEIFVKANATHSAFSLEYRLRHVSGEYRWAIDAAAPWLDRDGTFRGYIGSVIDITERKKVEEAQQELNALLEQRIEAAVASRESAEAQLRHSQKMEAVGKLTGGVAHDFNNLLQVIAGNLQLLSKDVAGNERAVQRVQNALAGVDRGAKLAAHLLAFGRRQPLVPKVINLGRLVRNMDDMLRRALGEGIELETVIAGGLWNTYVDANQVENALLNLAINSRDAMQGHGKLTIEAGNAFLDDAYAKRHAEVASGQYVMLAVSDTGCGIAQDQLDRVFEPFFTTKAEGEGTGLGLSMVYGFIKQSGGHIKIYSEVGHGTTVRMYLPRTRQAEDVLAVVDAGPLVGGTETVLVVEDDEDVRATVVDMLADLGYRVLKAKDADSALVIVDSGVPIDLLFTDVVMPGKLRSPELARKAKERLPGLAVLFTSGYTENSIVHGGKLDEGIELISKPYTKEALSRRIRHVLANEKQRTAFIQAAAAPVSPASAAIEHAAVEPSGAAPRKGLRLMLVEDDELIRTTTTELLRLLGHEVHSVETAHAALALLETHPVDVLITDMKLPGMSGAELVKRSRAVVSDLPVLVISGLDVRDMGDLSGAAYLRKPYDGQALQDALMNLMKRQ